MSDLMFSNEYASVAIRYQDGEIVSSVGMEGQSNQQMLASFNLMTASLHEHFELEEVFLFGGLAVNVLHGNEENEITGGGIIIFNGVEYNVSYENKVLKIKTAA